MGAVGIGKTVATNGTRAYELGDVTETETQESRHPYVQVHPHLSREWFGMISLLHHLHAILRPSRTSRPDVDVAAPLVHLLKDAEPAPDLLSRIEAEIDEPGRACTDKQKSGVIIAAFAAGLIAGSAVMFAAQDRQAIVARPSADASWVPLGSVTLHGSGLRGFVRAKCNGHTHFLITMHGHAPADDDDKAVPLMGSGEKILMECIF